MNTFLTPLVTREVVIPCREVSLKGDLAIPSNSKGLVLFAHGSGSSRKSPRNRQVAELMHQHNLATLLFDLLSDEEAARDSITTELRFNINLLAQRLLDATQWACCEPDLKNLPFGYFGSSTGAAAALVAAAEYQDVKAIVSRGGRSDLADHVITEVTAPTLFLVGGNDEPVLEWNRSSSRQMLVESHVQIIPGASHLFSEPGTLETMSRHAAEWLEHHLALSSAR